MRFAVPLAAAIAVGLAGGAARADEPAADAQLTSDLPTKVEPRYPPSSVRFKLFAGGVGLTGGAYAISYALGSSFPEVPGFDGLKIPVVGPWLALGKSGCASDDPDCGAKVYFRGVGLVLDGIAQFAGLGLIIEGIVMKTQAAAPPPAKKDLGLRVRPMPLVSAQITGIGIVGTF